MIKYRNLNNKNQHSTMLNSYYLLFKQIPTVIYTITSMYFNPGNVQLLNYTYNLLGSLQQGTFNDHTYFQSIFLYSYTFTYNKSYCSALCRFDENMESERLVHRFLFFATFAFFQFVLVNG